MAGNRGGVCLKTVVQRKGVMEELELDYAIIKLKKKSPRSNNEEKS